MILIFSAIILIFEAVILILFAMILIFDLDQKTYDLLQLWVKQYIDFCISGLHNSHMWHWK